MPAKTTISHEISWKLYEPKRTEDCDQHSYLELIETCDDTPPLRQAGGLPFIVIITSRWLYNFSEVSICAMGSYQHDVSDHA